MLEKISSYFRRQGNNAASQLVVYLTADTVHLLRVSAGQVSQCSTATYTNEQWQSALRPVLAELPSASVLDVILAPEFYQLVQLDKPALTDAELLQALPWQVKDLVTVPAEDMLTDYIDLPGQSGAQAKINVVVARLSWLKQLVQCVSSADMQLKTIQPAEWLAHHLIAASPQPAMLVIHQPEQEVLLQIVQDGRLYFSRRTRGLTKLHLLSAQDAQGDMLERLLLEVQRSMDYFESQLKQAPVRDIRVLTQQPDLMCKLLADNGFGRVEPLRAPLQLGAYSNQFVDCWPAIAAAVAGEALP
ncbi:hypothetical protein MN202_16725 [Rheinheimera muenzenbergensis]|uniref:MSHA biogenesis protein MshI n=1 Tax=Rheinheimera muenzenbergensis TaxID=1193628 RepID=A0ABU8CBA7_9GAMM